VYISPRLTSKEISDIYKIGYDSKSSHKPPPFDYSMFLSFFNRAKKYKKNNSFLDIGCFRGDFLFGAKEFGWNVYGTEISKEAVDYGKENYDLDIHLGSLLDANFENDYFDVVTLFDVLEHLTNPNKYLAEIFRILRPGGLLYLDTPNFNSINRFILKEKWSVFFPWHLYYFTSSTLKSICSQNNLEVKKIITEDWGPFSTYDVYNNLKKHNEIVKKKKNLFHIMYKFRRQLKPMYKFIKTFTNLPLRMLSLLGIHIGSKSILIAEKPQK